MITAQRKHTLFDKDFTHTHLIYRNSELIGEAKKYGKVWSFNYNGTRLKLKPIFSGSNYKALSDAVWIAVNRYELSGLTGFEVKDRDSDDDDYIERESNYRRKIVHIPSNSVFNSTKEAAVFAGLAESTIRTYVNPKYRGASYSAAAKDWEYYDEKKHIAISFY